MNRIKELRKRRGLTQIELADRLEITQGSLSAWETGRSLISAENLKKLGEVLQCSTDEILGIEEKEPVLVNDDPELTEYLEQLKSRPEMRMLFSLTKTATKKDVEKAVEIIEAYLRK